MHWHVVHGNGGTTATLSPRMYHVYRVSREVYIATRHGRRRGVIASIHGPRGD
jgi:hypothetical protein